MRTTRWLAVLVGLLACGLIAAGCGDDDESTTAAPTEESTTEDASTAEEGSTTEGDTSDNSSIDSESFYNACVDAAGANNETSALPVCEQARDALEECANQAEASGDEAAAEEAIATCQDVADQAVEQLEAIGG